MEAFGSLTENTDKSKNLTLGLTDGVASGNLFVSGYKDGDPKAFPRPTGPSFAAAGASLGVQTPAAGGNLQAAHIPNFGKQLTASANVKLLNQNDHRVDAHAFTTRNLTNGPLADYSAHGGGLNYSYKDKLGVGVTKTYTPILKMQEQSVSGNLNLHKTPTSSFDLSAGVRQTSTPFGRGQCEPRVGLTLIKRF